MSKNLSFLELEMVDHKEIKDKFSIFADLANGQSAVATDGEDYVDDGEWAVETNMDESLRTSSEIGSGHLDNDRERIDVDSFKSDKRGGAGLYLADILKILDGIEEETALAMKEGQVAQIEAGLSFIDYLVQTEKERGQLD